MILILAITKPLTIACATIGIALALHAPAFAQSQTVTQALEELPCDNVGFAENTTGDLTAWTPSPTFYGRIMEDSRVSCYVTVNMSGDRGMISIGETFVSGTEPFTLWHATSLRGKPIISLREGSTLDRKTMGKTPAIKCYNESTLYIESLNTLCDITLDDRNAASVRVVAFADGTVGAVLRLKTFPQSTNDDWITDIDITKPVRAGSGIGTFNLRPKQSSSPGLVGWERPYESDINTTTKVMSALLNGDDTPIVIGYTSKKPEEGKEFDKQMVFNAAALRGRIQLAIKMSNLAKVESDEAE